MDYHDAQAIMWLGLALLFAAGGLGIGYALWRVGRLLRRVEHDMHRTVDEVVPIIAKTGVSMDHVNDQLGKVDVMLDSAVSMTQSLDTAVRAVSVAVTEPVRKVSGAVAGAAEAVASFRTRVTDGEAAREHATAGAAATSPAAATTATAADDVVEETT